MIHGVAPVANGEHCIRVFRAVIADGDFAEQLIVIRLEILHAVHLPMSAATLFHQP